MFRRRNKYGNRFMTNNGRFNKKEYNKYYYQLHKKTSSRRSKLVDKAKDVWNKYQDNYNSGVDTIVDTYKKVKTTIAKGKRLVSSIMHLADVLYQNIDTIDNTANFISENGDTIANIVNNGEEVTQQIVTAYDLYQQNVDIVNNATTFLSENSDAINSMVTDGEATTQQMLNAYSTYQQNINTINNVMNSQTIPNIPASQVALSVPQTVSNVTDVANSANSVIPTVKPTNTQTIPVSSNQADLTNVMATGGALTQQMLSMYAYGNLMR